MTPELTQKCVATQHNSDLHFQAFVNTSMCYSIGMGLGDRIREERERRKLSQPALARLAGTNQATIDRLERDITKNSKYLPAVLQVLGLSEVVPVVGYVGAGAENHYYTFADAPEDWVPMPPGGNEKTVAVEVRGDSLGSIFNTWLVYYDDRHDPPRAELLRKLCVVGLADGRVLVKKLMKGSQPGLFNLESNMQSTIEDAVVEWAAPVRTMTPR